MALLRRAARGGAAQLAALTTPVAAFSGLPSTFQALGATLPPPQRAATDLPQARAMHPAMLLQRGISSTSTGAAETGPLALYRERVGAGMYRADSRQEAAVEKLQRLHDEITEYVDSPWQPGLAFESEDNSNFANIWSALGGGSAVTSTSSSTDASGTMRGLYMHGGVGAGKTMLMDMFALCAPSDVAVERTHFHDFMLDVHKRLHRSESKADPLDAVSKDIVREGKGRNKVLVLCLDEFMVTDVADAMILNRLFNYLFRLGVVLIATSNRAPDKLYEGGLQRDLFVPFIANLKKRCESFDIMSTVDYRRLARQLLHTNFFVGRSRRGLTSSEKLEETFLLIAGSSVPIAPTTIEVQMGRSIAVQRASGKHAIFHFAELCETNVAAADYIALCGRFHTVALDGIPVFDSSNRPAAYRFVTLIDVLYEHRVRLLAAAAADPFSLFAAVITQADKEHTALTDFIVDDNLGFAKDRIISRLTEMQSHEYARAHAESHAPELLVELQKQLELERDQRIST